jgi:hypothetical protein
VLVIWVSDRTDRAPASDRHASHFARRHKQSGEFVVRRALGFGFTRRESTRVLLVATNEPAPPAEQLALDGANWLITRGDSDIDRPW